MCESPSSSFAALKPQASGQLLTVRLSGVKNGSPPYGWSLYQDGESRFLQEKLNTGWWGLERSPEREGKCLKNAKAQEKAICDLFWKACRQTLVWHSHRWGDKPGLSLPSQWLLFTRDWDAQVGTARAEPVRWGSWGTGFLCGKPATRSGAKSWY